MQTNAKYSNEIAYFLKYNTLNKIKAKAVKCQITSMYYLEKKLKL